jgi:hypothetical protein
VTYPHSCDNNKFHLKIYEKNSTENPTEKIVFIPDGTGHFVPQFVVDFLANLGKPKKDRSNVGGDGKENAHHRAWSKKSRRAKNRNTQ